MRDDIGLDAQLSDQRFQLLINAVSDYAIYMLDPGRPHRHLESGSAAVQGL